MTKVAAVLDKYLIPDLAAIVLEYCQLEHVDEVVNGYRCVYTMLFGKKHGEFKRYYRNGELFYSHHYVNNDLQGESTDYYSTGELWYSRHYVNGKLYGEYKEYYPTGELMYSSYWINGKLYGELKCYYQTGELRYSEQYVNDVLQ